MTTLLEQLELMREKMRQMSETELQMVRGLGEALNSADERLREQVRQFAAEHNERRSTALEELRALSARLGALPKGRYDNVRQTAQAVEPPRYEQVPPRFEQPPRYEPAPRFEQSARHEQAPRFEPPRFEQGQQPGAASSATGDWRRATSRIEEEISLYQNVQRARAR